MNVRLTLTLSALCFLLTMSCNRKGREANDFDKIQETGELTIITLNSSISYFIYREDSLGYDYELAKDFCDAHNLKLNVKVGRNVNHLLEMLKNGEGDLIAYPMPVMNEWKDTVYYSGLQLTTHQVLVQRATSKDTLLKDVTELIGKDIYVLRGTKYYQRLQNLNNELGGGINIHHIGQDSVTTEDLIEMVAASDIRFTVSDEYEAKLSKTYHRNINISLPLSFDQRLSWAVSKSSPALAEALNEWFAQNDSKLEYKSVTKKYFELSKQTIEGEYVAPRNLPKGSISIYDDLFKKHAKGTQYDWRLLAAISYRESRFVNNLTSWAGASGIMGLMPRTARSLGLDNEDRMNPDMSIGAAVRLLDRLDVIYAKGQSDEERLKLMLAAYNGGDGHVADAQALARKYGADPYVWEGNVKKYLELKNNPEYYEDPVCKRGYFRAGETTAYVDLVLRTTQRFKQISK